MHFSLSRSQHSFQSTNHTYFCLIILIYLLVNDYFKFVLASRCFASDKLGFECGVTIHPNSDNRPARWAYDAVSKVCIPLYMPNNYKNCTLLGNLPYTRKECETFCGEYIFEAFFFFLMLILTIEKLWGVVKMVWFLYKYCVFIFKWEHIFIIIYGFFTI